MAVNMFLRRRAQRFAELVENAIGPRGRVRRSASHSGDSTVARRNPLSGPGRSGPDQETGQPHHGRFGHPTRGRDDSLAGLVDLSRELADRSPLLTRPGPDPDFRASLRQRLMADAALHGIGATRVDDTDSHGRDAVPSAPDRYRTIPAPRRPRVRLALVGGVAVGALAVSGVAAASSSAVPGDALYNVKRSTEQAQIALAGSDINSGQLYLEFARKRATEAVAVRHDPNRLIRVLTDLDRQTRSGVALLDSTAVSRRDAAPLAKVNAFVARQRPDVAGLLSGLNGNARTRALQSLALVDEVERRSGELRRLLLCTAGRTVQRDALGPIPQNCSAMPGGPVTVPSGGSGNGRSTEGAHSPPRSSTSASPKGSAPQAPGSSPSESAGRGLLPGVPGVPGSTARPSASSSPTPGTDGHHDGGGLFGTIGKILGGLL